MAKRKLQASPRSKANLDDGAVWPTSFALNELTAAEEKKIGALLKKAVT